jgi:hypothetical protein
MSDQCGYWADGQYQVRDLESECRGLRTDVDNLLAELVSLKGYVKTLRDRIDANEMAGVT